MQIQRFEEGKRQRYFADDDKQQLKDLVAQQRYEGAADMDANLADNILRKGKRFRWGPFGYTVQGLSHHHAMCSTAVAWIMIYNSIYIIPWLLQV